MNKKMSLILPSMTAHAVAFTTWKLSIDLVTKLDAFSVGAVFVSTVYLRLRAVDAFCQDETLDEVRTNCMRRDRIEPLFSVFLS